MVPQSQSVANGVVETWAEREAGGGQGEVRTFGSFGTTVGDRTATGMATAVRSGGRAAGGRDGGVDASELPAEDLSFGRDRSDAIKTRSQLGCCFC